MEEIPDILQCTKYVERIYIYMINAFYLSSAQNMINAVHNVSRGTELAVALRKEPSKFMSNALKFIIMVMHSILIPIK